MVADRGQIRAEEGTLSGGSISNRSRDERWQDASGSLALSQTGNWLRRRLDINGDGAFTGTGELDDTGAFSLANELKTRDTDSNGTANYTLAFDKSGNQTDDGKDYLYDYDAFGRLVQVRFRISPTKIVAQYRYNGLSFRIGWRYDSDASGGGVDGGDPWYYFCHDDAWRIVATFRAADADPKEVFVHHNAGLGGFGGSSYIDSVILRDRDADTKWSEAADDTRDERRYYCQNWRADVSALLTDAGSMVEWVKYSSYGVPFALPAGDTDSDGDWDATDSAAITGTYDVRKDANLDGVINAADVTHANSITGGYQTLGRGRLSSSGVDNRKGYAGYEYDPTLEAAGKHLYHVRHRVYDADIGRWMRRDPLGYVDGMSLYEYVRSQPISAQDPYGLVARRCDLAALLQHLRDVLDTLKDLVPGMPFVIYPGGYHPENPFQHCVWNCRMTKAFGPDFAEDQSYKKELIDVQLCRLARDFIECGFWEFLPAWIRNQLAAFCQSANQPSDWWDNAQGRQCGLEVEKAADCEACCQSKGITPETPEGPGTDRPYGPCQLPKPWDPEGPDVWWPNCPDPVQPDVPEEPGKPPCWWPEGPAPCCGGAKRGGL